MAERGLLTDREREILQGDADVSDSYRYRVVSRVRNKIERVAVDAELLREHREDLLAELQAAVNSADSASGVDTDEATPEAQTPADGDDGETDVWPVVDRVAAEEWNGTPERLEQRKRAASAVLDYLAEHDGASKKEAQTVLLPEHSVDGQDARTWWRKTIRPVLNEAATYDNAARAYQLTENARGVNDK